MRTSVVAAIEDRANKAAALFFGNHHYGLRRKGNATPAAGYTLCCNVANCVFGIGRARLKRRDSPKIQDLKSIKSYLRRDRVYASINCGFFFINKIFEDRWFCREVVAGIRGPNKTALGFCAASG